MSETLIKVEGLYKKFTRDLKRGLVYGTADTLRSMVGIDYKTDTLRKKEFWALQDINFELKRGEVLGLIGRNGCGKSTLLRLLSGIFPPDRGKITIKGRIGALIAVGAGFHPHMSGRENIYLNGTLLGMDRHEIKKRFEEIVEFAEIGEFIDAPVATYSSGMRVRLGFAIAVHIDPDVLLIDEVLAVGDMGFTIKCLNAIEKIIKNSAVIFVSHNMQFVNRICSEVLVLNDGAKTLQTKVISDGIDYYARLFNENKIKTSGSLRAEMLSMDLFCEGGIIENGILSIPYGRDLKIGVKLKIDKTIPSARCKFVIWDNQFKPVVDVIASHNSAFEIVNNGYIISLELIIKSIDLNYGNHYIAFVLSSADSNEIYLRVDNAAVFYVKLHYTSWATTLKKAELIQLEA